MPMRNGTGPFGTGRAGRGLGPCTRAYGFRGWADEAEMLRKEKEAIENRLAELEKQQ